MSISYDKYEAVIGLEVHAELNTKSKIFCGCENRFGAEENTNVCPVCLGLPGALPVLNRQVVTHAAKMGLATGCTINRTFKQDRKNYFYPDLPKAYQISQFDVPVCENGNVNYFTGDEQKAVRLTRIHIEEDAGKLLHDARFKGTLVDMNRCGVPLIEIVTEPDLRSAADAKAFLETIKLILQYLNISDCKMQEGSIRCDINVSIRPVGTDAFGTRIEMKNVNSFSAAERAINYEIKRQIEIVEEGGSISQETRRWDDAAGENIVMRTKEDAHDYRYFPDPDLCPVVIDDDWWEEINSNMPEIPFEKTLRYMNELKLSRYDAEQIVSQKTRADFFEKTLEANNSPKTTANLLLSDIAKYLNDSAQEITETKLEPENLAALVSFIDKGIISSAGGKKVLNEIFKTGEKAEAIIDRLGLRQNNDENAIYEIVKQVLDANPKSVEDYKSGKTNALGFLVGQVMKASRGSANPVLVNKVIKEELEK